MRLIHPIVLSIAALCTTPAMGQQPAPALTFDPSVLFTAAQDLLRQTPDAQIDGLYLALQAALQDPQDAQVLCGLFAPGADRRMDGWRRAAEQVSPQAQQALVSALGDVLAAALQGGGQRGGYDQGEALQLLKSNIARGAMLHDGFVAGFGADAADAQRCQSFRQMLGVLGGQPQSERVAVIRLLLDQGLQAAAP